MVENESFPPNKYLANIDSKLLPYFFEAKSRIFSISAGDRIAKIVTSIMRIGVAKMLYAFESLGGNINQNKSYVIFSPDGSCTYNPLRLKRGFAYGSIIKSDFNGLLSASNSMPNGCGFSIFKLNDDMSDEKRIKHIEKKQKEIGEEFIYQLGKGNHFAGLYEVKDPVSGEDTGERHIIVHCSGHSGTKFLYDPDDWLKDVDGFHEINTPHGNVHFLEGEAKKRYISKSKEGEEYNAKSRIGIISDVFGKNNFEILEEITHQGISEDGLTHKLGVQIHSGNQPIAFNPDEGIITVKAKKNLTTKFLDTDPSFSNTKMLGLTKEFKNLNFTPHGSGYEFKHPVSDFKIYLNNEGLAHIDLKLDVPKKGNFGKKKLTFNSFRDIRDNMTYRRKFTIMKEIYRADLIEHINDLFPIKQIYPLVSIPGGTL